MRPLSRDIAAALIDPALIPNADTLLVMPVCNRPSFVGPNLPAYWQAGS
jgi:hypothetical protein